jgi:hypothetical protein
MSARDSPDGYCEATGVPGGRRTEVPHRRRFIVADGFPRPCNTGRTHYRARLVNRSVLARVTSLLTVIVDQFARCADAHECRDDAVGTG